MTEYEVLVREEIEATTDRARFDTLDPAAIRVDVTGSFRRQLGECRPISRSGRDATPKYEIRIARRLFEDGRDDQWRDTVRHEVAHAYVLETVSSDVDPHGREWKDAARRAGADPVARCEGDDIVDAAYVFACPNGCFEHGYVQRSKRIKNPWQYTCDECGTHPLSYDVTDRPNDPEPGTCYVASIPWQTQDHTDDPDDTRSTVRYLLACSNGCTAWSYQRRTKRIKNPWLYSCPECDATLLSCDIDDRPTDLESGQCHVASIPWQEPRIVHACPNGCFSVGFGQHTKKSRQPERYRCEKCGARTVAYPADDTSKLSIRERTTSSDRAATLTTPTWTSPEHRYVSTAHVHTNTKMPHECDACGETFTTLSRLRLHDCPEAESASQDPLSSFDAFLDSISDALEADMQRNVQEREKRGLEAASETLKTNLEAAAQGDVDAGFRLIAQYERELKGYHDAEDYDTYRGIFWAFYEPATEALDEIAMREGWDFLADLIDAYPRESSAGEPLASPVIENAVGRHVVRTRLRDGVAAISVEALAYLGSFWESMGDVSGEESFTYGWGIGHPEHSVADHLHEVVTEELFWVRGVLPHTFYADQHAAADLLEALLTDERVGYEDRYLLASILATVDRDSAPQIPRYWNLCEKLDYQFEFDEAVKSRLRETIETEGFHERLPENWTFSDMDV